jgi:hypothetical protein
MRTAQRYWIMSPIKDLILFFPAVWGLILLTAFYLHPQFSVSLIPWQILILINSLHTGMPIAYAFFFMNYLGPEKKKRLWIGSGILLAASVAALPLSHLSMSVMTLIVPTLFVVVSTYHFYRQDLGVISMYRGLDRGVKLWEKKYERVLVMFLAFLGPTLYWLGTGTRYYSVIRLSDGPIPLVTSSLEPLRLLGLAAFVAYLGYQLGYRRNFNPRFLYMTGVFIAFMSMLQPGLFFLPVIIQYVARILTHNWVEIGFQMKLIREESKSSVKANRMRIGYYFLVTAAITVFFTFSKVTYRFMTDIQEHGFLDGVRFQLHRDDLQFQIWVALYFFLSALHYYIGRYVYDFSSAEFRAKLVFAERSKS